MEALLTKLRAYSRQLELEDNIPYWESQIPELQSRLRELEQNRRQKQIDLDWMEEPNLFQRLFGRFEDKKEKLTKQLQEIRAAHTAVCWELESLEKKITEGKRELEALAGSRGAYEAAKAEMLFSPAQESCLMMEELSAFAPVALETAWRALEALEAARPWMQKDALTTRVGEDNRKMECLYNAQAYTRRLRQILSVLPEGTANVGSSFEDLYAYICGVTSEFKQLDRLNSAIEQVRTVRNQLKLLLVE